MVRSAVLVTWFALSLSTPSVQAQEPASEPPGLQQEVARLNGTMKEIVRLLEKQIEGQETDLLIRRSQLSNRSLGPAKERLRQARVDLTRLDDEETSYAQAMEMYESERPQLRDATDPEEARRMAAQVEQMKERLEVLETRRQELKREIAELENGVLSREQDMRLLEELIDARLGLR